MYNPLNPPKPIPQNKKKIRPFFFIFWKIKNSRNLIKTPLGITHKKRTQRYE